MTSTTLDVDGMTCGNCAAHVTEALKELPGVSDVSVDLNAGEHSAVAVVSDQALDVEAARAAIDDAGYTLVGVR
ncbi:MAG: heavy-metal-associated domain-containing protein [Beutenbergiaceae bacterium]